MYVDGEDKVKYPYLFCIFIQLFPGNSFEMNNRDFSVSDESVKVLDELAQRCLPDGMPYEIYHQFNVGDFCLALRTNDVLLGYHLASEIRTHDFSCGVVMDTYTIVGIAKPCENQFDGCKIGHHVALRFSIRDLSVLQSLNNLLKQETSEPASVLGLKGLTGRYDVTLTLTLERFQQLYPFLWKRKFDVSQDVLEKEVPCAIVDPVVKWFCHNLSEIEFINERLLVTLSDNEFMPTDNFSQKSVDCMSYAGKVERQNAFVREFFHCLNIWTPDYDSWYMLEEFRKKLRMLEEVWNNFSDLRYQRDACINGNMFFAQMCLILLCVEQQVHELEARSYKVEDASGSDDDRICRAIIENGFHDLIEWLSTAYISMQDFHFRLQAINRQSLHSPVYECQMQMDPGKYLVAYTEFARLFLSKWSGGSTPKQNLLPFLSIDFHG